MRKSDILIKPILSEKVLRGVSSGWYCFVVSRKADKIGVKSAIEKAFGVEVVEVRLLAKKGKQVRDVNIKNRLVRNKRTDLKKAYVKLKEGQLINLLGEDKDDDKKKLKSKSKKILDSKKIKEDKEIKGNKKSLEKEQNEKE
jgi:large subunit ribosomal protein L23